MKFLRKVSIQKDKKPEIQIHSKELWQSSSSQVFLISCDYNSSPSTALKLSGPTQSVLSQSSQFYKCLKHLYPKLKIDFYSYNTSKFNFFFILPTYHQISSPISSQKTLKSHLKSLTRFHYTSLPISLSQELYINSNQSYCIQIPKIQSQKVIPEDFWPKILQYFDVSYSIQNFCDLKSCLYSFYVGNFNINCKLNLQDSIQYVKENFGIKLADTGSVLALAVDRTCSFIAIGGLDGHVKLWNFVKNEEVCVVKCHRRAVYHLQFTNDSLLLLSGGNDKNLCFLTLGKKKKLYKRQAHANFMNCLSIAPNNRLCITGGDDGIVQLWDLTDYCILASLKGHINSWRELPNVLTSDISQEQNIGITGGADGYIRIWRLDWRCLEGSITSHSSIVPYIPKLNLNFQIESEESHYENVTCVKFFKNSKFFSSGGEDGYVKIWDLMMKELVSEFKVHRSGRFDGVKVLAINSNDTLLASGGVDGKVALIDLQQNICDEVFDVHNDDSPVTALCFSPDDRVLVTAGTDGKVGVINVKQKALEIYVDCHYNSIVGVRVFDSEKIISFGLDGFVKLWNLNDMSCVAEIQGYKGLITAIVINPYLEEVVTGGFSGYIKFWKINKEKIIKEVAAHKGWVSFLTLGPQGQFLISGGSDGMIKIWDSATKTVINKTQCGRNALIDILMSQGQNSVIAASNDNKLYYWDTQSSPEEVKNFSRFLALKKQFPEFRRFIDYLIS